VSERLEIVKWTGEAPPVGHGLVHRFRLLRWLIERRFSAKQIWHAVMRGAVNPTETPQCEEILVVEGGACRVVYRRT
jgi:hypothetical protein